MSTKKSPSNWKRYLFELISVFLGVTLAFALSTWNEKSNLHESERKTLREINNSLLLDLKDIKENIVGHQKGLEAGQSFIKLVLEPKAPMDSVAARYFYLFRDFISVQNTSAYESLKSKGIEIVKNDSLRLQIIGLYDFHFQIVEKLEETYFENQFHQNYFHRINNLLASFLIFDDNVQLIGIQQPIQLSKVNKNLLLSYLWKMQMNRTFILKQYQTLSLKVQALRTAINTELAK